MAHLSVLATYGLADGAAEDWCTNTWHFEGDGPDFDNALDMVIDFYTSSWGAGTSSLMASLAAINFLEVKAYDMGDPKPRAPRRRKYVTVTGAGAENAAAPHQLAACLSYQSAAVSGIPRGRRRGRMYFGPIKISAVDGPMVSAGLSDRLAKSAAETLRASNNSLSWTWSIYSRTDNELRPIERGYIDNSWDIIRSRKQDPTSRKLFSPISPE